MEFVKRGASPKGQRFCKDRMGKNCDECAADNKILLDLKIFYPGCLRSPFRDIVAGDHNSASTSILTRTLQIRSVWLLSCGAPERSGTTCLGASPIYALRWLVASPAPM